MDRIKDGERTEYYRRQAFGCAAAASASAIAEIKEAYLNLEQGWLCLAAKTAASSNESTDSEPGHQARPATKETVRREAGQ